jgi:serine/threonine-protein kinase
LLLGDDGRVRILDLGLATVMDDDDLDRGTARTSEGGAVGTADYMSPEQAICRDTLDGRSDQYSLGCVMYHLLSGQVPFPEESRVECLARRIKGRPRPVVELRPSLPPGLVAILERMMANRREDRYATAAEVAEALGAFEGCAPVALPVDPVSTLPLAARAAFSSISVEGPALLGPGTSRSESILPTKAPGWWLRFLTRLSEQPPWLVVLACSAVLLAAFIAGMMVSTYAPSGLSRPFQGEIVTRR